MIYVTKWLLTIVFKADEAKGPVIVMIGRRDTGKSAWSSSILETCGEHESKIINCGDRNWYITACGHLIVNGNPIVDIRDVDFSH